MDVIFAILKFLVLAVYFLFLVDSILNMKHELIDFDDNNKEEDPFSWFDIVYFAYALFNFIFIVKFLHI